MSIKVSSANLVKSGGFKHFAGVWKINILRIKRYKLVYTPIIIIIDVKLKINDNFMSGTIQVKIICLDCK